MPHGNEPWSMRRARRENVLCRELDVIEVLTNEHGPPNTIKGSEDCKL